jgi:hypothetical protein
MPNNSKRVARTGALFLGSAALLFLLAANVADDDLSSAGGPTRRALAEVASADAPAIAVEPAEEQPDHFVAEADGWAWAEAANRGALAAPAEVHVLKSDQELPMWPGNVACAPRAGQIMLAAFSVAPTGADEKQLLKGTLPNSCEWQRRRALSLRARGCAGRARVRAGGRASSRTCSPPPPPLQTGTQICLPSGLSGVASRHGMIACTNPTPVARARSRRLTTRSPDARDRAA